MPSPRRVWPDRGSKLDEPKFWRDEWLHNLHAPLTNMGTKLLHVSSAGTLAMYTRTGVLPPVGNWRGVGFQEQGSTHSHSGVNQHCCNAELLKQCVPSLDTFSRHSLVSWFPFFFSYLHGASLIISRCLYLYETQPHGRAEPSLLACPCDIRLANSHKPS